MTPSETASHTIRGLLSDTTSGKKKEEARWINEVREKVNSACPMDHSGNPCTIFKVPQHIRQLDDKAYNPVVASFGPFHRKTFESSYWGPIVQDHKWRCVRYLLSCHGTQDCATRLLERCLLDLKEQDSKVRRCYSQKFSTLDAQDMASIMLLDGCFIIYLMLTSCAGMEGATREEEDEDVGRKPEGKTTKEDEGKKRIECTVETREGEVVLNIKKKERQPEDPTVAGLFTRDIVVHDLLKLENQIPFFIIQLLFDHLKISKNGNIDLVNLALQLFKDIHPKESKSFKKQNSSEYHHLLHLFYSSRIPLDKPAESTSSPGCIHHAIECIEFKWKEAKAAIGYKMSKWKKLKAANECKMSDGKKTEAASSAPEWIPSATELDRAGVRFKKKKLSEDSFLNITFEWRKVNITPLLCLLKLCLMFRSGRMEIPPLQIYDYTGPLFRNLIAFEQCYRDTEMYITIYALFMDCIIDKAEDVRLLHLVGILEHKLSSDQAVAELFNKLGCQIHFISEKNYLANQIERVNKFYDSRWHKWLAGLRRDYLGNPWAILSVLAAIILLLLTIEQAVFSALSYLHSS